MQEQTEFYRQLTLQAQALVSGEPNLVANLANLSALLFDQMDGINWSGFYLVDGDQLVLGPFQGKTACVRIPKGRGVCGTAMATGEPQLVADVHAFEGHIACDAASESEVVIPLKKDGKVIAVLDIDAPTKGRFDQQDLEGLISFARVAESIF